MHLHYETAFNGEDGDPTVTTEVFFSEDDIWIHRRMLKAVEHYNIDHDRTVFPERIVLVGNLSRGAVYEIINRREQPVQSVKGVTTEQIITGDYL